MLRESGREIAIFFGCSYWRISVDALHLSRNLPLGATYYWLSCLKGVYIVFEFGWMRMNDPIVKHIERRIKELHERMSNHRLDRSKKRKF